MFLAIIQKPSLCFALLLMAFAPATGQNNRSSLPPGAPTAPCSPQGAHTFEDLRVFRGTAPVPLVSHCAEGQPATCYHQFLDPTKPEDYQGDLVAPSSTQANWTCAMIGGWSGWIPTDRLAHVPTAPAIRTEQWLGTWVSTHAGARRDRLSLTRSAVDRGVVHVTGHAYYTTAAHAVNYGDLSGDALAMGPFLHIFDQTDQPGCILDLTYNPANHTFRAVDNQQCGGFNVSFDGVWRRTERREIAGGIP